MKTQKYDLEDRLVSFAVAIILICKDLKSSFAAEHLAKQLIRSATSAALNYGEAQSAQSPRDFSHKMRICLKELRETRVNLKIQKETQLIKNSAGLEDLLKENNELIAIFVSSIRTSEKRNKL